MFRQLTFGRRAKRHLSCAVVPVVTCSGENSAASHATSARTRSMAHGGAGGSAEKILRLSILREGSDRRHKQTARPWTLRRKPVPGEKPDARWLATTPVAVVASIPYQCPGTARFRSRLTPAWHVQGNHRPGLTHRSTTGQPRAPCHGTMSTHFRRVRFPAHTVTQGREMALVTVGLAARPGRHLVPAVDTFRAQASRRGAFATPQCSAGP